MMVSPFRARHAQDAGLAADGGFRTDGLVDAFVETNGPEFSPLRYRDVEMITSLAGSGFMIMAVEDDDGMLLTKLRDDRVVRGRLPTLC